MSLSLLFFMNRFNNINILNETNNLLRDLYNLDSGAYSIKNGIIYHGNYKIGLKSSLNGSGDIEIDKYKNVRFNIIYENKCISKTYLGNTKINNGKCSPFKNIEVTFNKNNNKISFISDTKNLEYMLSYKDDFNGYWISDKYKDNIVLKSYNDGINYIWFKDSDGNISDAIEFKIDCLYTNKTKYDKNVFYCSGSTVKLDDIDFVVIKDTNSYIELMKFLPIDEKMSHCTNDISNYCFYKGKEKNTYNWSNSYINYYINNVFINKLSEKTKSLLIDSEICDDVYSTCNNESCVGLSRDEIENNKFICNSYTTSKIKLISYDEFNYVYSKTQNKNVLNGNYWSINSITPDYGSTIQYDLSYFIYEDLLSKKDVKPVIKYNKDID